MSFDELFSFSTNGKGSNANPAAVESFDDVFKEISEKVPDSTSTIEEKELAISYLNRMLACKDIPNPEYWENKKDVIEMEIMSIENKNSIQNNKEELSYSDIQKEFNEFVDKYNKDYLEFENPEDGFEYWTNYHNTCQSFIQKLFNCPDLPDDLKTEYKKEYSNRQLDINNIANDLKKYKSEK